MREPRGEEDRKRTGMSMTENDYALAAIEGL
jgi:hypothetical protein